MEKEHTLAIELLVNLLVDVGCLKEPIPVSSIPHLGEKTSEFEIISAVRMEFLFGVIFD
jgi:hypothetical protein